MKYSSRQLYSHEIYLIGILNIIWLILGIYNLWSFKKCKKLWWKKSFNKWMIYDWSSFLVCLVPVLIVWFNETWGNFPRIWWMEFWNISCYFSVESFWAPNFQERSFCITQCVRMPVNQKLLTGKINSKSHQILS